MGETSITCGNCGTVNDPDAKYCRECGALLAAYASPAGAGPVDTAGVGPTPTDDARDATTPIDTTSAAPDPRPPLATSSARDPDRVPVPAEFGAGTTDPPSTSARPDETASTTALPRGSAEPTAEAVATETPDAEETTPTLAGTLGSGALGPIGTASPSSPPTGATASGSPPPVDAAPAPEGDRRGRSDAGASEPGVENGGPVADAPSPARPSAPAPSRAPAETMPPPVSPAAWTDPDASASGPPPATSTSMFGGFATGDRFSTVATAPPRTILTIGGVLILASCVILAADLPGYLTLLSLCAGPVGFILLIVGGVMLLSQRPDRRF